MFNWLFDRDLRSLTSRTAFRQRGLHKFLLGILAIVLAIGGFGLFVLLGSNSQEFLKLAGTFIVMPLLLPILFWGLAATCLGLLQVVVGCRMEDIPLSIQILGAFLVPVLLGIGVYGGYQIYEKYTYQTPLQIWRGRLKARDSFDRLITVNNAKQFQAEAIPELQEILQSDDDPKVQAAAAAALGDLGTKARESAIYLEEAMKANDEQVRYNAAVALTKVGVDAADAVPILIDAFQKDTRSNRWK